MASNNTHDTPSIDSATTNTAPSEHSTPAMSDQINDIEKGAPAVDQPNRENDQTETSENHFEKPLDNPSEKTDAAPSGPPGPGSPPDGGFQAWMVVVGAFCGLFVSFGWINCKLPYPMLSM